MKKIISFILLFIAIVINIISLNVEASTGEVIFRFNKQEYLANEEIQLDIFVNGINDLYGFQIDIKENQEFGFKDEVDPFRIDNGLFATVQNAIIKNEINEGIATLLVIVNNVQNEGYTVNEEYLLASITLKAKSNIANLNNIIRLTRNYDDLFYESAFATIKLSNSDGMPIDFTGYKEYIDSIEDTEAPVIELIGDSIITIDVGSSYNEKGTNVSDNIDTDVEVVISGLVNTEVVNEYIIKYTATDSSGNSAFVIRTVKVVDKEKPTAYLKPGIDTVYVGEVHVDTGVEASDNYDTSLNIVVDNPVDTNVKGEYIITYTISDSSKNEIILKRYVNVIEKQHEVIFHLNPAKTTLSVNEEFTDTGCNANINGETQNCNIIYSNLDTSKPGTYKIIYSIEVYGVKYMKTRYVFVFEQELDTLILTSKKEEEE